MTYKLAFVEPHKCSKTNTRKRKTNLNVDSTYNLSSYRQKMDHFPQTIQRVKNLLVHLEAREVLDLSAFGSRNKKFSKRTQHKLLFRNPKTQKQNN